MAIWQEKILVLERLSNYTRRSVFLLTTLKMCVLKTNLLREPKIIPNRDLQPVPKAYLVTNRFLMRTDYLNNPAWTSSCLSSQKKHSNHTEKKAEWFFHSQLWVACFEADILIFAISIVVNH